MLIVTLPEEDVMAVLLTVPTVEALAIVVKLCVTFPVEYVPATRDVPPPWYVMLPETVIDLEPSAL